MNPNDVMVVVLKDILLCWLGFMLIYIVYISWYYIYDVSDVLLPPKCLSFGQSVSPACLSVNQTSVNDSGHYGKAGQLLNSRVLSVLKVITLFMTQVSVCQSQSKLHSVHPLPFYRVREGEGGRASNQILKRGFDRTSTFRGGLLGKSGFLFWAGGGAIIT